MAIAFAQVSIHTRSKGHSAIAASAYRTASRLTDERTGITHDYTNRKDFVFSELVLPEGVDEKFKDREFLWNEVERVENRVNSQLCKDVVLALPKEIELVNQIELTRRFVQTHFTRNGIPADVAIHDDKDGNPHAHILVTLRRLERDGFAKHKARDLNPEFAFGKITEKDFMGEQWREMQNDWFMEKGIDMAVDLNHIIPEEHEGIVRDAENHHVRQTNALVKKARTEIALDNAENLINALSLKHSVFTRRDIETLLFKSLNAEVDGSAYLAKVEEVLGNRRVIALGANDYGQESFTTKNQYVAEARLLKNVEQLQSRGASVFKKDISKIAHRFNLNDEQTDALSYIANGRDISLLIGRPGVGKSYLLNPVREYFEDNGRRVMGAALSGKVAKALQADTGIKSSTLASLTWRLQNKSLQLSNHDVIIVDEAGMADFSSLSYLLDAANKARAKVVLVGDPDQLKPINKGEIFRGIASRTGFMELGQIRRQHDEGDRQASLAMSKGDMDSALSHYEAKGAVHFSEYVHEASENLVARWKTGVSTAADIPENVMFAFSRAAVLSLNIQAREELKSRGILESREFDWQRHEEDVRGSFAINDKVVVRLADKKHALSAGDIATIKAADKDSLTLSLNDREVKLPVTSKSTLSLVEEGSIRLAKGERILFRKNDQDLGVRNGDMAFVESVAADKLVARLDSGERVTVSNAYKHIDYGYASTVHKGQGMTVDNAFVQIDSKYWDKFLAFVAMTRHRKSLNIFADRHQHPDMSALKDTLSRAPVKDNVIDWPLDFAIRAGFDPDKMIGRTLNRIAGIGNRIKNGWNYVIDYETYLKNQDVERRITERKVLRETAKEVAGFLDEASHLKKTIARFDKEARAEGIDKSELPGFGSLYQKTVARDKRAFELHTNPDVGLDKLTHMKAEVATVKHYAERYERYQAIEAMAGLARDKAPGEVLVKRASKIDLEKDYVHIKNLAKTHNKTPKVLYAQIEEAQKSHRKALFAHMKTEYPVLAEYDKLYVERSKATGFKAEQLDKALLASAKSILGNKILAEKLQQDLPKFAKLLSVQVRGHSLGKGIED